LHGEALPLSACAFHTYGITLVTSNGLRHNKTGSDTVKHVKRFQLLIAAHGNHRNHAGYHTAVDRKTAVPNRDHVEERAVFPFAKRCQDVIKSGADHRARDEKERKIQHVVCGDTDLLCAVKRVKESGHHAKHDNDTVPMHRPKGHGLYGEIFNSEPRKRKYNVTHFITPFSVPQDE
jgi:hypothetical protein